MKTIEISVPAKAELSHLETADLCRELALLLHSGITAADALYMMAEEEKNAELHSVLRIMAEHADGANYLHQAFDQAGCFPAYVIGLLRVGEEVGRTEETLSALANYYEKREKTRRQIVSSLTYPAILLMLMLVVILVLLSKVLPVFNEIYMSLGGQLGGMAGALLLVGQFLKRIMPLLCVLLALAFAGAFLLLWHRGLRSRVLGLWKSRWGDKGIARRMNNAKFAQALAMAFGSGMVLEDAVEMAAQLLRDCPQAAERCRRCREELLDGAELSKALGSNGLMDSSACRMLSLALRSGSGDSVMEELALRMEDEASWALEKAVARLEPALVLITSLLVGIILLSVMLPLMNIMTAIG